MADLPQPFLDPSLQGDYDAAVKKQQMAQMLMGAFQKSNQTPQDWNSMRIVPHRGALQNVSALVSALMAGKTSHDADAASKQYLAKLNAPAASPMPAQMSASSPAQDPVGQGTVLKPGLLPEQPPAPAAPSNPMIPEGMDRTTAQRYMNMLGPAKFAEQFLAPNYKMDDFEKEIRAAGMKPGTMEYAKALQDKIHKDTFMTPIHLNQGDTAFDPMTGKPIVSVPSNSQATMEGLIFHPETGKYADADGNPLTDAQVQTRKKSFAAEKAADIKTATGATGGELTGDALDTAAQDYRRTGKLPALARDNATKMKIMNRSAEIERAGGNDAAATVLDRQNFKANQLSLNKVTSQKNMIGSFEKTFEKNLALTEELSKKVDRTGSPLLNRGIQAWRTGVSGDPETKGFINALTTARDEYAKILSGATGAAGITDSARAEAEKLFSTIDSPETFAYVANVARQETHNRMSSLDEQIGDINGHLGKPAEAANLPTTNAKGWALHKDKNGDQAYVSPDGKQYEEVAK